MRKTVTTVAAASLLFVVAACGDGFEGSAGDQARSTTTTTDETGPGQATTTTSGDSGEPGDSGESGPDDDPGNNEVCEGQTPVWAYAPVPADRAPARAELASYGKRGRAQQPLEECAQPEPELGTGDVQITLRWESSADLDLHVTEPNGTEIYFGDKGPTSTGGRLDVDSNVSCNENGSVENVFWPTGQMPTGEYTVEVHGYTVEGCGSGRYTVVAQVQGREVLRETGSVDHRETDTYSFTAE